MNKLINITLAAAAVCVLGAVGAMLDMPSETELAQATAADVIDAKSQAAEMRRHEMAEFKVTCLKMYGENAQVLRLKNSGDLVCRRKVQA